MQIYERHSAQVMAKGFAVNHPSDGLHWFAKTGASFGVSVRLCGFRRVS